MNRLLVVCGPTATGKTSLGITLAKKFNGEIISADSRQVYKRMDIGTGKEYDNDVKIWGYDLVDPEDEFSVGQYLKAVSKIIKDIVSREKLPILVGGTGLYIKGVVDGIPTANVPKNKRLRKNLDDKSVTELFGSLANLDSLRAGSMNSSDSQNPARLIRAIEVSQFYLTHGQPSTHLGIQGDMDVLFIGLSAPTSELNRKVEERVEKRLKAGIKKEIERLLSSGVDWHHQSMMSLGYRQWRDFFEAGVEEVQVVAEWKREEKQYVRRQMTWFKKDPRINWFDISDRETTKNVEKLVEKWHNRGDA